MKDDHHLIRMRAEENNSNFRKSRASFYTKERRRKKFWWRVWFRLEDIFKPKKKRPKNSKTATERFYRRFYPVGENL